jgi:alpha-galactosidase
MKEPPRACARKWILVGLSCVLAGCGRQGQQVDIVSGPLHITYNPQMHSRLSADFGQPIELEAAFSESEYAIVDGQPVRDFTLSASSQAPVHGLLGDGRQYTLSGLSAGKLEKELKVTAYDDFPGTLTFKVTYRNRSDEPRSVSSWVSNAHTFAASPDAPTLWSYQGASYEDRRDWVLPINPGFTQDNYMGMNADDYGSGTPVSDIWRRDVGLAVGHLETEPRLVSLPVRYPADAQGANLAVEYAYDYPLPPGAEVSTAETFVTVHRGDYYAALKTYRRAMARKGLVVPEAPEAAYEPIWCAWGYERNFSVAEIRKTLPEARKIGLKWAVLDDGWQTAEGDWYLHPDKFPRGDADMQGLVDDIRKAGLKPKLWWAPLAADPGTDLLKEHGDMLLLDKDGEPRKISWWDSYYLCPAYAPTVEYSKALVRKFMQEWGYQGLKIDGQHLNGVPRCYNPEHHHNYPEESVEGLQTFWRDLYQTAQDIDKDVVFEICPCGTSYAFFNFPYMNQSVSSDPLSSWQVRLKGKTIKALAGESAAYYGDHVELSDNGDDFASSFGIGAVLGTKFTISTGIDNEAAKQFLLTGEKRVEWQKWISLYNELRLSQGEYLGELYDIGYDRPEAHAIRKGGAMYYAFYADDHGGPIELRGLDGGRYRIVDYVNQRELGTVSGPLARVDARFERYLLVEATPLAAPQ